MREENAIIQMGQPDSQKKVPLLISAAVSPRPPGASRGSGSISSASKKFWMRVRPTPALIRLVIWLGICMMGKRSRLKRARAGKATAAVSWNPSAAKVVKDANDTRIGPCKTDPEPEQVVERKENELVKYFNEHSRQALASIPLEII